MKYTELHLHTSYSLLDGLNSPEEYMQRANEIGMTHLAITDHGTLIGHRDFQRSAKAAGITPILGCEMYISGTDRFDKRAVAKRDDNTQAYNHLTVLAQNEVGLKNLNKLSEIAWTEGFYSKPRIDMEVLEEYNDGLIILSGCLNGLICKAIDNDQPARAEMLTREFKRIFGERFFIEQQQHNPPKIIHALGLLAEKHNILEVTTSDCHFARKEDMWREEAMLILSTNPQPDRSADFGKSRTMDMLERFNYLYPKRQMSFEEFELYLHSAEDHLYGWVDSDWTRKIISNTQVVANMIGEYPYYENLDLLPQPKAEDPAELLRKKVMVGMKSRGLDKDPEAMARVNEELDIICAKPAFPVYFLIEANTVAWAKSKKIRLGPGRGSGAGSMVNYALGITAINPLKFGLLFFRFINPERNDMPDIDTDVEDRRRPEIKSYSVRQYKHVASILTLGTYQYKNAVRDAARVFQIPLSAVNIALKGADWPKDWWDEFKGYNPGFVKEYPEVIELAKFMYGRPKSLGMHAGGLVMSKEPISNYAPIQTAKDPSDAAAPRIPVLALDMNEAADVGFIKYDWLGLKALSILSDTLDAIETRHGKVIDLEALPLDDQAVYDELSQGNTRGVFQCEAGPYTNTILDMGGVKNFDELVASNALVRPGSMKSTAGKKFMARKTGTEDVSFTHPDMEWFTKDTYGVVIYQEQVMLTMTDLAGMKMSTADKVRKIIGKKRDVREFEQFKAEFIDGASQKVSRAVAEGLWHDFEAHAGYSFNKSHAVAYSMLSYWTAWLKQHYPLEFMTAVLKNEKNKDSLLDYLIEVKRLGLRVMLPHINKSGINFEIQTDDQGDYIRFGLSNVKYISDKIGTRLLQYRPFDNYQQLLDKVMEKGSGLNTRVLMALNAIGGATFDDNPKKGNERDNFYEILNIPAFSSAAVPPFMKKQFVPLEEYSETGAFVVMAMVRGIKVGDGWARLDLVDESGTAGVFTDPTKPVKPGRQYIFLISNNRIARYFEPEELYIEGEPFVEFLSQDEFPDIPDGMQRVVAWNGRVTKAGKRMGDVVFSDNKKNLTSALVFPGQYMSAYSRLKEGAVVDVRLGKTDDGALFVTQIL